MDVLNSNNFTNTLSAFLKNRNSFGDIANLSDDVNAQNIKMILDNSLNQNFDINSMLGKVGGNQNLLPTSQNQLPQQNPFGNLNSSSPISQMNGSPPTMAYTPNNNNNTPSNKRLKTSSANSKSGTKKSFVWKYFRHPTVDGVVDRSRTQCLLCDSQLAFNASGTTTTMLNHLKSRHGEIAETEENIRRVNRSFNQSHPGGPEEAGKDGQSPSFKLKAVKMGFDASSPFSTQSKKQSRMNKSKIDINETISKMNNTSQAANNFAQRNSLLNNLTRNFNGVGPTPSLYSEMNQAQDLSPGLFANFPSQLNNPLTQNLLVNMQGGGDKIPGNYENFLQTWLANMNTINAKKPNNDLMSSILNNPAGNPLLQNLTQISQTIPGNDKQAPQQQNGFLNSNFLMNLMNFLPMKQNAPGDLNGVGQMNLFQRNSETQSNKSDHEEELSDSVARSESINDCPSFTQKSPLPEKISFKRKHENEACQNYSDFYKDKGLDLDEGNATDSDQNNSAVKREKLDPENFQQSLTYFLVKDLASVDIVEGAGFKRLWNFNLPTAMKIRHKYMQDLENVIRMKLLTKLNSEAEKVFSVSLLVDVWDLENDQTFCSIGFCLNFKNASTSSEEFLWKSQPINPSELSQINEFINKCLEEINFEKFSQDVTVVTTNRPKMLHEVFKASEGSSKYKFIVMPCLMASFDQAIAETMETLKLSNIFSLLQKNVQKTNKISLRRERRSSQLSGDSENSSSVQSVDSNIEFQDGNNNRDHSTESILSNSYNLATCFPEKNESTVFNTNELVRMIKNFDEIRKHLLSNRAERLSKLLNFTLKKMTSEIENSQEFTYTPRIYEMISAKILDQYKCSPETTLLIDQMFLLEPTIKDTLFPLNKSPTHCSLSQMVSNEAALSNYLLEGDRNSQEIIELSRKYKTLASPYSCILTASADTTQDQFDHEFFLKKRRRLDPKDVDIYTFLNRNWYLAQ